MLKTLGDIAAAFAGACLMLLGFALLASLLIAFLLMIWGLIIPDVIGGMVGCK